MYGLGVLLVFTCCILDTSKLLAQVSETTENGCWPRSIVLFELDRAFDQVQRQLIFGRMQHISKTSCLRFHSLRDYPVHNNPKKFVLIKKARHNGELCNTFSDNGNVSEKITIELGTNCTDKRGILHELVHALGFRHEHQRVDRECYVEIFWEEVWKYNYYTMDLLHPDNNWMERFPYDKTSIMHFKRSDRLRSRDERWYDWEPLGNNVGSLSSYDIWKINYKHCLRPHYCDVFPEQCDFMESKEKEMDCKKT